MRISMMIVSRGSLCLPLAIVTVMAVSTIRVSIAITMRVTMMIISWLGISFSSGSWFSLSLAVVAMMTITSITVATIAMMIISWFSISFSNSSWLSLSLAIV